MNDDDLKVDTIQKSEISEEIKKLALAYAKYDKKNRDATPVFDFSLEEDKMKISVGISNRHVHLSFEDYNTLFKDTKMEVVRNLNQPTQFASNLFVTIKTLKDEIKDVRVLGPIRNYTQVELSKTDCYKLGVNPPVRDSGDIEGSEVLTIIGPFGSVTKACGIIATRHIHVDSRIRAEKNLVGIKEVSVKIPGEKGGIINHVHLKDSDEAYFELHLDTDDANAHLVKNGDIGEIIL